MRSGNYSAADEALEMALVLDTSTVRNPERAALLISYLDRYVDGSLASKRSPSEYLQRRYNRILERCEQTDFFKDVSLVDSISLFGRIEWGSQQYERSGRLLDKAIAAAKSLYGVNDPRVEAQLFNRASLALKTGDLSLANEFFNEGLTLLISARGEVNSEVVEMIDRQAEAYAGAKEYDMAELLFEKALAIQVKLRPGSREVAFSAHKLAKALFHRKDYKGARQLLMDAVGLMIKLVVTAERRKALLSDEIAMDDFAKVEREAALLDPSIIPLLHTLALTWHETGPPGLTMIKYENLLAIYETTYGPDHTETGLLLTSMGSFYGELSNKDKQIHLLERAKRILETNLGPEHSNLGSLLYNLACAWSGISEKQEEAKDLLRRCLRIREKAFGPTHERLALPVRQLAYLVAKQDPITAFSLIERAVAIEETEFVRELQFGSERQKTFLSATIEGRCNSTLAFHVQYTTDYPPAYKLMMTIALRSKGRVMETVSDSLFRLRRTGEASNQELLRRWSFLIKKESELYKSSTEMPERDPDFDRIIIERENLEMDIALRIADTHPVFPKIDIASIQQKIPEGSLLVEFCKIDPVDFDSFGFFFYENEHAVYGAFILGSSGDPNWINVGNAVPVDTAIGKLRNAWIKEEAEWKESARALDILLLEPLRIALGDIKHIMIVPAGDLCLVPFDALVDSRGDYEIQHYTFIYLTTGRDLLRPTVSPSSKTALIVAGPDFEHIDPRSTDILTRHLGAHPHWFQQLPNAIEEGRILHKLIPDSMLVTGCAATSFIIEEIKAPAILHIATHGFFMSDIRDDLYKVMQEFSGASLPSPLLRSGIALAGANNYIQGLLTALEISSLDLWGTEMVVMSACDTGLGDITSWEGIYGLRRSFFLAGAASLLVSLFPVPDEATTQLMETFYKRLINGQSKSVALHEAQRNLLASKETSHPVNWAAFILIGDQAALKNIQ